MIELTNYVIAIIVITILMFVFFDNSFVVGFILGGLFLLALIKVTYPNVKLFPETTVGGDDEPASVDITEHIEMQPCGESPTDEVSGGGDGCGCGK